MKTTNNKTSKKQTKKTFKPAYIVDLTNAFNERETIFSFIEAKLNSGSNDFTAIDEYVLKSYIRLCAFNYILDELKYDDNIYIVGCGGLLRTGKLDPEEVSEVKIDIKKKRQNIFKRFWNWITRKK